MSEDESGSIIGSASAGIVWDGGGEGRIVTLDEETIVVRSSKPFAPGSRPTGVLASGIALRLKTHRCRRDGQDEAMPFSVDARVLDLTRALRSALQVAISRATSN